MLAVKGHGDSTSIQCLKDCVLVSSHDQPLMQLIEFITVDKLCVLSSPVYINGWDKDHPANVHVTFALMYLTNSITHKTSRLFFKIKVCLERCLAYRNFIFYSRIMSLITVYILGMHRNFSHQKLSAENGIFRFWTKIYGILILSAKCPQNFNFSASLYIITVLFILLISLVRKHSEQLALIQTN